MWPDRVSNPGPLTYESGALPIALRGPASSKDKSNKIKCRLLQFLFGALRVNKKYRSNTCKFSHVYVFKSRFFTYIFFVYLFVFMRNSSEQPLCHIIIYIDFYFLTYKRIMKKKI